MQHPSRIFDGATRHAGPLDGLLPQSTDWCAAKAAYRELQAIGMPRVNLLLVGRTAALDHLLALFQMDRREPISAWDPGEPLVLPAFEGGTLVLRDIGDMAPEDQHRLLTWLNSAIGRTQVISTTCRSLVPEVEAGTFNDTLYYRLNTVLVDVD